MYRESKSKVINNKQQNHVRIILFYALCDKSVELQIIQEGLQEFWIKIHISPTMLFPVKIKK